VIQFTILTTLEHHARVPASTVCHRGLPNLYTDFPLSTHTHSLQPRTTLVGTRSIFVFQQSAYVSIPLTLHNNYWAARSTSTRTGCVISFFKNAKTINEAHQDTTMSSGMPKSHPFRLLNLPPELVVRITEFLGGEPLPPLRLTCKSLEAITFERFATGNFKHSTKDFKRLQTTQGYPSYHRHDSALGYES
jgi:hypothetical protein